jgi:hypothetical protein
MRRKVVLLSGADTVVTIGPVQGSRTYLRRPCLSPR